MHPTEHLINAWHGIVDLSPLTDVEGRRLVLQPTGMPGSAKEIHAEVADHPHVQRFLRAGWVWREPIGVNEPASHADTAAPVDKPVDDLQTPTISIPSEVAPAAELPEPPSDLAP